MSGWEMMLRDPELNVANATRVSVQPTFEEIFSAHHCAVYRYAYTLTHDTGLAEDIVQEVFVRLHKNFSVVHNEEWLCAWLLRVAANLSRNMLRRDARARARDESFVAEATQMFECAQPDEVLLRKDEIDSARRSLNKIKEPMRSCLLLKHEGLSYREIAKVLGINEANVGTLIARGRREFIRLSGKIGK